MCTNYKPVTLQDRLLSHFGVVRPDDEDPLELIYPGFGAPFIVRPEHRAELARECLVGLFGLLPEWAPNLAYGRNTYNCRTESMRQLPSFKQTWFSARRCIIPAEWIYENCHETGDPVRWRIQLSHGGPMGVAGLWGVWKDRNGVDTLSFTMLTVSGAGHAIYERMHAPGDEKRMPVIVHREDFDGWLNCAVADADQYLRQYPAELLKAEPDPAPWKKLPEPKSWAAEPDMFQDEWRHAAEDPAARMIKARRARQKPKGPPPLEEDGPSTGDLF